MLPSGLLTSSCPRPPAADGGGQAVALRQAAGGSGLEDRGAGGEVPYGVLVLRPAMFCQSSVTVQVAEEALLRTLDDVLRQIVNTEPLQSQALS